MQSGYFGLDDPNIARQQNSPKPARNRLIFSSDYRPSDTMPRPSDPFDCIAIPFPQAWSNQQIDAVALASIFLDITPTTKNHSLWENTINIPIKLAVIHYSLVVSTSGPRVSGFV